LEKDPITSKLSLYLRIYGGYGSSANEEYITIENTSKDKYIDITDFKLKSTSTNIEEPYLKQLSYILQVCKMLKKMLFLAHKKKPML
jgi:hypothetical protein